MPTKKKSTESASDPEDGEQNATESGESESTANYSGSPAEGQPPPEKPKNASEDAVVSDVGVTEPTKVYKGDGLTTYTGAPPKNVEPSGDETFSGNFKLTGKTFHGKEITNVVNVPSAVTKEGLFNIFRAHNPDAIPDGFTYEEITPPEPPPQNGG